MEPRRAAPVAAAPPQGRTAWRLERPQGCSAAKWPNGHVARGHAMNFTGRFTISIGLRKRAKGWTTSRACADSGQACWWGARPARCRNFIGTPTGACASSRTASKRAAAPASRTELRRRWRWPSMQAAPALGEALQRGSAARSPPRPPSRYFGEPMVDMFRPWVRSTVAALKGTCVQPSALQPMGSRSLFSTAKATKMIMVVVVLEGFCSFLTTPRQRPRARSSPRPDSVAANSVAPPDSVADVTARMRAMAYVSSLLVRIAPAWRRKLTSNMLLLVISRSFSNRLLVVTATKSRREETEDNEHRRIMRLPTLGTRKSSS